MQLRSIDSSFVWLHRLIDALIPPAILFLCVFIFGLDWKTNYKYAALLSGLLLPIMNQYNGIYHSWRGRSIFDGSRIALQSWLMVWAALIISAFLLKISDQFSRVILAQWFLFTPVMLVGYRLVIRIILSGSYKTGIFNKKVAIYGSGATSIQLRKTFNRNPWLGYQLVSIYDDLSVKSTNNELEGDINKLLEDAKAGVFQTVYIALPASRVSEIKLLLNELSDTTATVKYLPDLFSFDLLNASVTTVGGMPVINIFDTPLSDPAKALVKRLEDITISSIILILISPVLFLVAAGVKYSSPGPVFYKQTRVGWNGKNFEMLKFRSMPVDTENNGVHWGGSKNKTTSRFGAFIRKTSLDELPQFINVLKGEMSIVGPRPERNIFVEQFRNEIPRYMQKHLVRAGITGWAQISGWRGDTDLRKRIEYDLYYIDNWSPWFDFKIIILTVFKGFVNRNAY